MKIKILASGSKGNSYLISDGCSSLLLDAGLPFNSLQVLGGFKILNVAGCLITHSHMDHMKAVKDLLKYGVNVYMSKGEQEKAGLSKHHRLKDIKRLDTFTVGSFEVTAFDVQHDTPEPLGFLVRSKETNENLLYFTDTYYLKYKFRNLHYIMAECNYSQEALEYNVQKGLIPAPMATRLLSSHMSLEHLVEMLQANDLRQLRQVYLLHMSDTNSREKEFKERIQKTTGAEVYIC